MAHDYLSTACLHEAADGTPQVHDACRQTCKFCDAPCQCPRHEARETAGHVSRVDQARDIARELLRHGNTLEFQRRIKDDRTLFWLRGEEQPPGTWHP